MKEQNKKIKVLVWGDSPASATGFATVIRGVFNELAKTGKYDIDIIGINDTGGWKDPEKFPYRIYPARSSIEEGVDYHGRHRLINAMTGREPEIKAPWDLLFVLNDTFILEFPVVGDQGISQIIADLQKQSIEKLPVEYFFKTIVYCPIDSPVKGNWIANGVAPFNYVVAYTKYGKRQIEKANSLLIDSSDVGDRTKVIYHGVNLDTYKTIEDKEIIKDFRSKFFRGLVQDHTLLVTSVARNQMRKDIPRTLQIFKEFQKRRPDSFLYLHCQETDAWGSLREYAKLFNLEFGKDWGVPKSFHANFGYSADTLNKIYNASDCILSTTHGEGWGFYNTEGFATKTIVVAPNNTVHPELFNYDADEDISDMNSLKELRGVPVKCGSTLSEWVTYGPADLERSRPLVNVEDAVKKLVWVYDNPEKVAEIEERAYKWVQQFTWQDISRQWDELFMQAYADLEKQRQEALIKIANEQKGMPKSKK